LGIGISFGIWILTFGFVKYMFSFEVIAKEGDARAGRLLTPHGFIETPSFVSVGTLGTVKAVTPEDLREMGNQVVITNAFHLHLRPGEDLISRMGGLHRFMHCDGPLIMDSGGFQIFSLGAGK
jgi:queuine tRNA-ribosyltransferase